jgi:hypothetical protein
MTSIQTLERIAPGLPMMPDKVGRGELEYRRHLRWKSSGYDQTGASSLSMRRLDFTTSTVLLMRARAQEIRSTASTSAVLPCCGRRRKTMNSSSR